MLDCDELRRDFYSYTKELNNSIDSHISPYPIYLKCNPTNNNINGVIGVIYYGGLFPSGAVSCMLEAFTLCRSCFGLVVVLSENVFSTNLSVREFDASLILNQKCGELEKRVIALLNGIHMEKNDYFCESCNYSLSNYDKDSIFNKIHTLMRERTFHLR